MPKNELNILSTRPLSADLIQQAKAQHILIDCISFIETEAIKDKSLEDRIHDLENKNIYAVFTSMNAVDAVVSYLSKKPNWFIYCIGQTTKELVAKSFSEEQIVGTANNASLLAEQIIHDQQKEIYFFCGDQRREELPGQLRKANILLHEIVVYLTTQKPQTVEIEYDGILFFSPSAVHSFFSANNVTAKTLLFAIGSTTAGAIKQYTNNNLIIAERPGKEALVHTMMLYFGNHQKTD
jgi:uroporphyrinogen-III synthase